MSGEGPKATTGPSAGGPLVAEDVVRLDLREAPTREEAGIREGERDLVLSRVGDAIDVELQLPAGTLSTDAFGVNIGGPVGDPDPAYAARVVVNVRGGDTAQVRDTLVEQAAVLEIDSRQVQDWAAQAGAPNRDDNRFFSSSATEPERQVEVRYDASTDSWTLNYGFSFRQPPGDAA